LSAAPARRILPRRRIDIVTTRPSSLDERGADPEINRRIMNRCWNFCDTNAVTAALLDSALPSFNLYSFTENYGVDRPTLMWLYKCSYYKIPLFLPSHKNVQHPTHNWTWSRLPGYVTKLVNSHRVKMSSQPFKLDRTVLILHKPNDGQVLKKKLSNADRPAR